MTVGSICAIRSEEKYTLVILCSHLLALGIPTSQSVSWAEKDEITEDDFKTLEENINGKNRLWMEFAVLTMLLMLKKATFVVY